MNIGQFETFWELVEWAATAHPNRVVLSDDFGRELTTRQLRDVAVDAAAAFAQQGIGPGTVVTWQLPTTVETMVVMVALTRLGAVQNPVLPIWRESEVSFVTAQLSTEVMIVPGVWRAFDHVALARSAAGGRAMTTIVVNHESSPDADTMRTPVGDPAALPDPPTSGDDARWVYYSSGTTAAPKGVRHTDRSVMSGSAGVVEMVGASSNDVNPIPFPVSHIGGAAMLAASLLTGMRLVLFDVFDAAATPMAIAAHRPTLLGTATPFFVAFMAAQDRHDGGALFPDLRACVAGGAPITPELGRQVRETLGVSGIANSWGLTEFPVATSPSPDADAAVLDHTVGPPVPGVQVRVVDDEGEVPPGEEGELRLKGSQCFLGYVDSSLDADAFDSDGWFRSGDRGRIDVNGNVVVTGRIKDAIIRNAENISALEIEGVLVTHPAVADVAVIGVPDTRTGERVCAVVVAAPGVEVSLSTLVDHCAANNLSRHKFPERLELVDVLPRNLTGKVLKAELRQRFT